MHLILDSTLQKVLAVMPSVCHMGALTSWHKTMVSMINSDRFSFKFWFTELGVDYAGGAMPWHLREKYLFSRNSAENCAKRKWGRQGSSRSPSNFLNHCWFFKFATVDSSCVTRFCRSSQSNFDTYDGLNRN